MVKSTRRVPSLALALALLAAPSLPRADGLDTGTARPGRAVPAGEITYVRGTCLVRHGREGPLRGAVPGQEVYASSRLKTAAGSVADLATADGAAVRLTPDSEITVHRYALGETRSTVIGLLFGRVDVVARGLPGAFQVESVTVIAGVRGTSFTVAVREDGEALVAVAEGSVSAELENRRKLIRAGERAVFTLDGEAGEPAGDFAYDRWRREAVERIRRDPREAARRMLAREREIIHRLGQQEDRARRYGEQWARLLRRVELLHERQRYEEELALIQRQASAAGEALLFFSGTRRLLTGVRSLMVLASRTQRRLDSRARRQVPELARLVEEHRRAGAAIERVEEAGEQLARVLDLLDRRAAWLREALRDGRASPVP
jgi:hypothetical protein